MSQITQGGVALKRRKRIRTAPYVFVFPAIIIILAFRILPMFYSIQISLQRFNVIDPALSTFVGLDNFRRLLVDENVWRGLLNTVYFAFGTLIPGLILSLIVSIIICERWFKLSSTVRAMLFVPFILSITITGLIWSFMYAPSFGMFNAILGFFGIEPQLWLAHTRTAMPSIILMVVWRDLGFRVTIWSAGLLSISPEYTEAARIDGATWLQELFLIRLPLLRPVILFLSVLGLIGAFQGFESIWVMTGGGPARMTEVLVITIWRTAFRDLNMGYASAIAWLLFFFIFILTLIQMKVQDREVH